MSLKKTLIITILAIYQSYAAVLLWSNHKIEISPLKVFDDEALEELIQDLGYPKVVVYKSHPFLLPEFKQSLKGYYKAYSPNSDLTIENATEISGKEDLKLLSTQQETSDSNCLSLLVISNGRISKREAAANASNNTNEEPPSYKVPKGPVFYKGPHRGKDTEKLYGVLYSSQPLMLKTSSSNDSLYLGNTKPDMIYVDTYKDIYMRLNVKINVGEDIGNLIFLQFMFSLSLSNYWTLKSVLISSSSTDILKKEVTANITRGVTFPAHFSYHCSGETVFTDEKNSVELYVYDLQTQIDSANGKFSDAYDCVNFVTGPILSGIFVSGILGIGLIIALLAIGDIKTMDKFDNYKTKQLVVTVSE